MSDSLLSPQIIRPAIWRSDYYKKMPHIICEFQFAEALLKGGKSSFMQLRKLLSGERPNQRWRLLMSFGSGGSHSVQ